MAVPEPTAGAEYFDATENAPVVETSTDPSGRTLIASTFSDSSVKPTSAPLRNMLYVY